MSADSHSGVLKTTAIESIVQSEKIIPISHPKIMPKSLLLLKEMEEEIWLSGSELQTDNSSSDENEPFSESKPKSKVKKSLRSFRKMTFSKTISSSSTSSSSHSKSTVSKSKTIHKKLSGDRRSEEMEKFISSSDKVEEADSTDYLCVDPDDFQWRPKRGSISLPGLNSEFERIEIN